jgi:hypothetical protein
VEELMRRSAIIAGGVVLIGAGGAGVAGSGLFSGDEGAPPEKAALLAHERQVQEEARREAAGRAKPADPRALRPKSELGPPLKTGIAELSAPFPAAEYVLDERAWQDVGPTGVTTVFAGALGADHAAGVVVVVTSTGGGEPVSARAYRAPVQAGALTLAVARGSMLTLRAESGRTFLFNAATREFVSG